MNTTVYVFTGTGNSLYAAKKTAAGLGAELRYIASDFKHGEFTARAEKIIFIFPVYYWGPPRLVKEFVERLDLSAAKYIAIMANAANDFGGTCGLFNGFLEKKGRKLNFRCGVKMLSNFIPFRSAKSADNGAVKRKLALADKKIEKNIEDLRANKENLPNKIPFFAKIMFNWRHDKTYPQDKKFYVTDACVSCGQCAKVCPAGDIAMERGRPVWRRKCLQCMACINYCPAKAIGMKTPFASQERYRHPGVSAEDLAEQGK